MAKSEAWTEARVRSELTWMNETLEKEEKPGAKMQILFLKELCIRRGYSSATFCKKAKKYEDCTWYQEIHSLIKDRLWCRLMKLAMTKPSMTSMAIWLDKTNYGTREQQEEQQEMKVNLTIEELK